MWTDIPLTVLAAGQAVLALDVFGRMVLTARGTPISPVAGPLPGEQHESVSVIVPVLNEEARLAPCLDGLLAHGPEVREVLVVDGGSTDGTPDLVREYAARDRRLRLVDARPVPLHLNGKAWGLQVGLDAADPATTWLLTVDADVRPARGLVHALLAQARAQRLDALSVAARQELADAWVGLLHPSLLATFVYRTGIPGSVQRRLATTQANGQCFLLQREGLRRIGGFRRVLDAVSEDITLARVLIAAGQRVGFYEAGDLVAVRMHDGWRDAWRNWSRSLPMRDRYAGAAPLWGWLEVALVQALPPVALLLGLLGMAPRWVLVLNVALLGARLGVLAGMRRAYIRPPWTYWLSPLCDLPVAAQLGIMSLRRRHTWRGRVLVRGGIA
jgi:dolichol-phosphate mannosyltransferase